MSKSYTMIMGVVAAVLVIFLIMVAMNPMSANTNQAKATKNTSTVTNNPPANTNDSTQQAVTIPNKDVEQSVTIQ